MVKKNDDRSKKENKEFIKDLNDFLEDEKSLDLLSSIFKALADPTRLKIIFLLSKTEMCVGDIAKLLKMSQSSISHQLAILREKELVKVKRVSRKAIYSLDDDHVVSLFNQGYKHALHKKKTID